MTDAFNMVGAITAKRDGHELTDEQIRLAIDGYVDGHIPDYQMSALLMAILLRGFNARETLTLTDAMVRSGETIDMSPIGRRIVDKHSTGGVGDKVSLALGPIVAACGVPFGKMSGRGLGHTGGTLDKLESIPGYRVELSMSEFIDQVRTAGIAIAGQTSKLVPADQKLYALRDVTGTVESMPLIAASIMSKKIAAGADAIVLDVKVGSGAFMKNIEDARHLATEMISIGEGAGREVRVMLTDMSQPLGRAVGNAIEINEVAELLGGRGPENLKKVVYTGASLLLELSDLNVASRAEALGLVEDAVESGAAMDKWREWITAQHGDVDAKLEVAPVLSEVKATASGFVESIDALDIGNAAVRLGAGRLTKSDPVDHGVGIYLEKIAGEEIQVGDVIAKIHARDSDSAEACRQMVENAIVVSEQPVNVGDIVIDVMSGAYA